MPRSRDEGRGACALPSNRWATFVKFGQLLSLRRDILPEAYVDELIKLQDQVPGEAEGDYRAIIEAEIGRPVNRTSSSRHHH